MAVKLIETPKSSNIREVRYENGTLWVTFNAGGIYAYSKVPEPIFEAFKTEPSAGKYFQREIKGKYAYKKVASGFGG